METPFPEALPAMQTGIKIKRAAVSGLALSFPSAWLTLPVHAQDARPNNASAPYPQDLSIISALRTAARPHLSNRTRTPDDHAQALGIAASRLKASLRTQDTTLARELKRLRIDVAKEMFASSDQTVASVAHALGYADQSHFARFFRSQTGQSPRRFRAQSKKTTP